MFQISVTLGNLLVYFGTNTCKTWEAGRLISAAANGSRRALQGLQSERREQHLAMGRFTCLMLPNGLPVLDGAASLLECQRHRLRVTQSLGEGSFGTVSERVVSERTACRVGSRRAALCGAAAAAYPAGWPGLGSAPGHRPRAPACWDAPYCSARTILDCARRAAWSCLQLHVCEPEGAIDFTGSSTFSKRQPVLAKTLHRGADKDTQ